MSIQPKDEDTFFRDYCDYKDAVYKVAYKFCHDPEIAADIMQRTFMKYFEIKPAGNEERIRNWLGILAKHDAINYCRKAKWELPDEYIELTCDLLQENSPELMEDMVIDAIEEQERKILTNDILEDIRNVNPRWYEALTLVYYLEIPNKDVAKMMGVSAEALQSVLQRAKKWIRKKYGEKYEEV